MIENEFITSTPIDQFIDALRLMTCIGNFDSFETVIKNLNLAEFENFDNATLIKENQFLEINFYFAYERNESDLSGTVAYVMRADGMLNLMALGINNLYKIFQEVKDEDFKPTEKLKEYLEYAEPKNPYSPGGKRLLNSKAFSYIQQFAEIRDFLQKKDQKILGKTAVVFAVTLTKFD